MTKQERREKKAQEECDAFNAKYAVGTEVRYWPMAREGEGRGPVKTRTTAQVLSGHTAVVWLEGVSGCMAISHIQPVSS